MSLLDLQSALQGQVSNGQPISVAAATLSAAGLTPATGFDNTVQGSLGLTAPPAVTVTGEIPAPVGNQLTVTGTATFLGVTAVPVRVVFTLEDDGTVDALIIATLPGDWTFSTSFPLLIGPPFNDLTLTQPCFMVTTAAQTSYVWASPSPALTLYHGLNFAAYLGMGAPLAILQNLIASLSSSDTIVFSGTIAIAGVDLSVGFPAMSLVGTVNGPITGKTSFDLSVPQIALASQLDENGYLAYWLYFSTTLSVNDQPFSTIQAGIIPGSPVLSFTMTPTKNAITATSIVGLIGGVDYSEYIPTGQFGDIFSSVGLTALGAIINVETADVQVLTGSIGTTQPWPLTSSVTLESMSLNCMVLEPFGSTSSVSVNFSAVARIFPTVFDDNFIFSIASDLDGGLDITGTFKGKVKLAKLLTGVTGSAVTLPTCLEQFEFEEFSIGYTQAGDSYDWTLYGSAHDLFELDVGTGTPLNATFEVLIQSTAGTISCSLQGGLQIGSDFFQVEIDLSAADIQLSASWQSFGAPLEFGDVASTFGWTLPSIPPDLDLSLTQANLVFDFSAGTLAFGAQSKSYGSVAFAALSASEATEWLYVVCLASGQSFSLSKLPLVGAALAEIENVAISDLQIVIGSDAITHQATISGVNTVIAALGTGYPTLPAAGISATLTATVTLQLGTDNQALSITLGGQTATGAASATGTALVTTTGPTGSSASSATVQWVTVQRSFGPVSIERIGVLYQPNTQTLWFALDATLAFGPLSFSLEGLGIGSPLTTFAPQFFLQGLGISYVNPPLEIAGTLINMAPPGATYIEFEGGLSVSTADLTLEAFGFYGNQSGFPALFVFGDLAYPIGGPPFLFVTGAALGFGYNTNLRLPTIDQVQSFPFVQVLPTAIGSNPNLFGPDPTPTAVLTDIMGTTPPWVSMAAGSLWFGAGITFSSFELVNSQALLFVETGAELVIAVVGDSRAQFPQQVGGTWPLYANIELDLDVSFVPAEGMFSAQAVLAPSSFLLDPACVLTGGFAFFLWYGDNPHAGDFVLTVGGYNPGFTPPSYYPTVPIVGFHWTMDASLSMSGGAYFALTPAAIMAGGALEAAYQSGHLKAWFDAHADFIVSWKPFWFDADIGILIGASYKIDLLFTSKTVTVELGCDMELWGPPTGGKVRVDWYVISFTVDFGSKKSSGQTLTGWSDVEAMLPNSGAGATRNILAATPTRGLSPASAPASSAVGDVATSSTWQVRGGRFAFTATTPVPVTTATVGGTTFNGDTFNVFPLGWTGVSSQFEVSITDADGNDLSGSFGISVLRTAVPASLWGPPLPANTRQKVPDGTAQLIAGQITGLSLEVLAPQIGATAGALDVQSVLDLTDLELPGAQLSLSAAAVPAGDLPVNGGSTISAIGDPNSGIASAAAVAARNVIFFGLTTLGYAPNTPNDPMTAFASDVGGSFTAEPLLVATEGLAYAHA